MVTLVGFYSFGFQATHETYKLRRIASTGHLGGSVVKKKCQIQTPIIW